LADLDELAVAKARVMYKKVHSKIPVNEIDGWSVEELLSNSGMIIDGKLTRAAIILLGKPTAGNNGDWYLFHSIKGWGSSSRP